MRKGCIISLILLTAVFCACSTNAPRVEYNGEALSREEIFALADQFPRETETEPEAVSETKAETREPADGIVYWTAGGEVWHEWSTCGHLSQKNEIKNGSVEDAAAAGKERGCSFCTEKQEITQNNDK